MDERCIYRCKNGLWTVTKHAVPNVTSGKLEDLLKTIDAVMREEFADKHPIKKETETKWILKLIQEEARALLTAKKEAEAKKISIDYSQLAKIRQEAAMTQEKLTVEEELEESAEAPVLQNSISVPEAAATESVTEAVCPLTGPEYRLLQSLLYGKGVDWVSSEGYLLSVLVDSINEKLYDSFLDSVLDDTPELIEDYIDDLKEMVAP